MGALSRAAAWIRQWVRTNITGDKSHAYTVLHEVKPQSIDDELRAAMETTEFIAPEPIGEDGKLNDKFVEFWSKKLVDFVFSLILAGFYWLLSKLTGRSLISEADEHNKQLAETILPAAIWLICFLTLTFRRAFLSKKKK